jgi:succinoglycan biosynthesis protein ExoH
MVMEAAERMALRTAYAREEVSDRIAYLRLSLIILLVFLHFGALYGTGHSPFRGYSGQDYPFASILVSYIVFLSFTAVPVLSAISGYLFFINAAPDRMPDFADKLRRRLKSLAAPFVVWSAAMASLAFAIHLAAPWMFSGEFDLDGRSVPRFLADAVLGLTTTPIAVQLWFVRDLIVTVALTPLIWLAVGRAPVLTIALVGALWIAGHDLWIFQRLDVLLFFCVGSACAMHGYRPEVPHGWLAPLVVTFLLVVLARTLAPVLLGRDAGLDLDVWTALMRILGACTVWNLSPVLLRMPGAAFMVRNSYLAFFIYCAHFPPILFVREIAGKAFAPASSATHLVVYVSSVVMTIAAAVLIARAMIGVAPKLFEFLSGGRLPRKKPGGSII